MENKHVYTNAVTFCVAFSFVYENKDLFLGLSGAFYSKTMENNFQTATRWKTKQFYFVVPT
jgi:hypothetical protein